MLLKVLIHIAATAAALVLMPQFIPGLMVEGWYTAFVVAFVWGLLSLTVRPILTLLTLPITIVTFGLFSFILNALLFWFLGTFIQGFVVEGFVAALLGSLVLTVVSSVLHKLL